MTFGHAIQTCLRTYVDFEGRASHPQFWWFILFINLVGVGLNAGNLVMPRGTISIGLHRTTSEAPWRVCGQSQRCSRPSLSPSGGCGMLDTQG
jgi:hypothetical protein